MVTKVQYKNLVKEIGQSQGWNPLGVFSIAVESRLGTTEREDLGKQMADYVGQIDKLEEDKKAFNSAMKERLDKIYGELSSIAFQHRSGVRIENKELPAFYNPRTQERHYIDPSTGEILKSVPAEKGDEQMDLGA